MYNPLGLAHLGDDHRAFALAVILPVSVMIVDIDGFLSSGLGGLTGLPAAKAWIAMVRIIITARTAVTILLLNPIVAFPPFFENFVI